MEEKHPPGPTVWPKVHEEVARALDLQLVSNPLPCDCVDCVVDAAIRIAAPIVIKGERERIASNLITLGADALIPVGRAVRLIREGRL